MTKETIFIHKANSLKYIDKAGLFVIYSPRDFRQTYSEVYKIHSIIDLIRLHRPSRIIINCSYFHAKDIVKFIFHIRTLKMYRLSINRFIYKNEKDRIIIIMLNFVIIVWFAPLKLHKANQKLYPTKFA